MLPVYMRMLNGSIVSREQLSYQFDSILMVKISFKVDLKLNWIKHYWFQFLWLGD